MPAIPLCISAILLVFCADAVSKKVARNAGETFWIFIAGVCLQLGGITTLLSAFHELNRGLWLLMQAILFVFFVYFERRGAAAATVPWRQERSWCGRLAMFFAELSPAALAVLICVVGLITLSGITQALTPIHAGDEKMYHASRVIYWIQNHSAFPFPSHNDRQTVFTFGSELFFLWPTLFTKAELVGRLVFWMAYPCAAIGMYLVARALEASQGLALTSTLVLVATPLVSQSSIGLKPELWSVVALLGLAYWTAAACLGAERVETKCFFIGLFTALSINMRPLSLILVPIAILIPFCIKSLAKPRVRIGAVFGGMLAGLFLSGLLIPFGCNLARYHHILGPERMRQVHAAPLSARQLYTHAVRLPFLLLELPDVPASAGARARISALGNRVIEDAGAGVALPLEDRGRWPGRYSYVLPEYATRFSLWGILLLPVLATVTVALVRDLLADWPQVKLAPTPALALLAIPLLTGILFGTRWMADSSVPERFLVGPYALAVPIGVVLIGRLASSRKLLKGAAYVAIGFAIYQPIRAAAYSAIESIAGPGPSDVEQPFTEALNAIPAGSCILFIGNNDAPDYPLFSAKTHYANRVVPWGKFAFDAKRLRSIVQAERVTHVLVQNDQSVFFHWDPAVSTSEMSGWLSRQSDMREVPIGTAHMRLFETSNNTGMNEQLFRNTEIPAKLPLIYIDRPLQGQVGLDPALSKTAWGVEDLGGNERGFLWIGQGPDEGVEFGVWSRSARGVTLRFNVSAGPSIGAPGRTVSLFQDGTAVAERRGFQGASSLFFNTILHPGRNLIKFYALDASTRAFMPNGDTRRLIVGLHDIHVEADPGGAPR